MSNRKSFDAMYHTAVNALASEFGGIDSSVAAAFPPNNPLRLELGAFIRRGGKRFRPVLSFVTAKSLGHTTTRPHVALELFHKFLLAHDDIIDEDTVRYSTPTLHAAMAMGQGRHFGESMGIIGGDLLASASYRIILDSPIADNRKLALVTLLTTATEEVAWGWYDQFLMDSLALDDPSITFDRVEQSIIWVTGKYSVKLPLLFGYALAGKHPPESLEPLASAIGALYQTGDDLIGLFGDESKTGKSNHGDISQGKKTLPLVFAYQNAPHADRETLDHIVGNEQATEAEFDHVRRIVSEYGIKPTSHYMEKQRLQATDLIDRIDLPDQLREFLAGFVAHIAQRNR